MCWGTVVERESGGGGGATIVTAKIVFPNFRTPYSHVPFMKTFNAMF